MTDRPSREELKEKFDRINGFAQKWSGLLVALRDARLADEGILLDADQVKTLTTGLRALVQRGSSKRDVDGDGQT